jgi:hypothetical protein
MENHLLGLICISKHGTRFTAKHGIKNENQEINIKEFVK